MTYSLALTELEGIINEIESEEINVDILAERVKRASYLIKFCKGRLAPRRSQVLSEIEEIPEADHWRENIFEGKKRE
jgi:exodeoxyribonuclease VII small subunit